MNRSTQNTRSSLREQSDSSNGTFTLGLIFFVAGIDGFGLLPMLKEIGARPFFLFYVAIGLYAISSRIASISKTEFVGFTFLQLLTLVEFALYGSQLADFSGKQPFPQFVAHSVLFLIGFSPLIIRVNCQIEARKIVTAARWALILAMIFTGIDLAAILFDLDRPFVKIFLNEGAKTRIFPTGVFSEPSYFAAFCGIVIPVVLYDREIRTIVVVSAIVGAAFFWGDVRSFFFRLWCRDIHFNLGPLGSWIKDNFKLFRSELYASRRVLISKRFFGGR